MVFLYGISQSWDQTVVTKLSSNYLYTFKTIDTIKAIIFLYDKQKVLSGFNPPKNQALIVQDNRLHTYNITSKAKIKNNGNDKT